MPAAQPTLSPPIWLRNVNIAGGSLISVIAGIMSVKTQTHLAGRLPDWADLAVLVPLGSELYAGLATLNWSAAPHGTEARRRGFHGVLIASGMSELMNAGEHLWAFVGEYGTLDWRVLPNLLLGSVPTLLVVLSVHLIASVLSTSAPEPDPVPEVVPAAEQTERNGSEQSDQAVPEQNEPEDPPQNENGSGGKLLDMATRKKIKKERIEAIRQRAKELADAGIDPQEEMTSTYLAAMFPDDDRVPRSWLDLKYAAIGRKVA